VSPDRPSKDEVRQQLEKILTSAGLRRSERLRRFLRLTVERTLEGQSEDLKEYSIGRDVFDRGVDFDMRTDSIVRVEARRLRKKLHSFYETEGRDDPVVIRLDPGSYVPVFARSGEMEPPAQIDTPLDARTIAVLPFSNLSPDPSQNYFCDGIAEDIIDALSAIPELRVLGRSTSFAFRDSAADTRTIGRELRAGTIVEGSVRLAGDIMRISAKVIEADTGHVQWSSTFDRPVADVFAIKDEISDAVASTLRAKFTSGSEIHLPCLDAYATYLRGRHAANQMTAEGYEQAVIEFKSAIEKYPDYALPYSALADVYSIMAALGLGRSINLLPLGKAAAQEAVNLDPNLAHAWTSLAWYKFTYDWNWHASRDHIQRAISLRPNYAMAYSLLGAIEIVYGRIAEGLAAIENSYALDPRSPRLTRMLAWSWGANGKYDDARKLLEKARRVFPQSKELAYLQASVHVMGGDFAAAVRSAIECQTDPPNPRSQAMLAETLAASGRCDEALKIVADLEALAQVEWVDPWPLCRAHQALGNIDEVVKYYQASLDERSPFALQAILEPQFASVRLDKRFRAVMARLNLPVEPQVSVVGTR
jgi:serine/threonine-protein kinase